MTLLTLRFVPTGLALALTLSGIPASSAQTAGSPAGSSSAQTAPLNQPASPTPRTRRHRRTRTAQQHTPPSPASTIVGPTSAQRQRDAQILANQKAQSTATARENDALTQKVVADQQRQQAEPRIQDAPGPDSAPLPGNPAVAPAQASDQPRIQDAPGPAQTLPQAPPPAPAPQQ